MTLDEVIDAYKTTGLKPRLNCTFDGENACALGVMLFKKNGDATLRHKLRYLQSSIANLASEDLGVELSYAQHVIFGFDGNTWSPGAVIDFANPGYKLGKSVREWAYGSEA